MSKLIKKDNIAKNIYLVRGKQVMLDSDLAKLYNVETKVFNQAVKRNLGRFPKEFRFQLAKEEFENLRSQIVTSSSGDTSLRSQSVTLDNTSLGFQNGILSNNSLRSQNATLNDVTNLRFQKGTSNTGRGKHRKYLPYVFTEQGVAMLSAVLRSDVAVQISIQIMKAFVEIRHFVQENSLLLKEINQIKTDQVSLRIETDKKFEQVFNALEAGKEPPKQGVFFNGQIFDAYIFVTKIIRKAKTSIVLIDNYVDDSVLVQLAKRPSGVSASVFTKKISKHLALDLKKHNAQYSPVSVYELAESHDRFLIIDDETVYHIGASLKDLGKKWFAFSKMDKSGMKVIEKIASSAKSVG